MVGDPNSVQATEFTDHMRAATVTIARLGMCISGELPQPGRYTSVTAEWPQSRALCVSGDLVTVLR